jgi:catechol 2,3-dioxygenase-like lactoylglutathione lyase family enzyme
MALNCVSGLVTVAARDFNRLVEFYSQLLEQEPAVLLPNQYAEFELPGVRLGIFRPKGVEGREGARERGSEGKAIQNSKFGSDRGEFSRTADSPEAKIQNSPRGMALCFEVEDLEGAIAHLTRLGYPPPGKIITASHGREIYAYDPEGNWLILHQGGKS